MRMNIWGQTRRSPHIFIFVFPCSNLNRMELLDTRERDLPLFYAKYPGAPRERMTIHRLKIV
jgi:hypothetical protein